MTLLGTDALTTGSSAQRWAALVGYRESIVRLARCGGAGSDAEDIAQEALLRAACHPGLDLNRAYSYVAKIASNLVLDLHRRTAKEQRLRSHAGLLPPPCPPDDRVEERDLAQHAVRLVASLSPDLRSILLLRRDGATWPQVAARLGQRAAAAEMRYRRAMTPLRQLLSADAARPKSRLSRLPGRNVVPVGKVRGGIAP